jgi:hypothetical protein
MTSLAISFGTACIFQCINLKGSLPKSTANSCSKNPGKIIKVPGFTLKLIIQFHEIHLFIWFQF